VLLSQYSMLLANTPPTLASLTLSALCCRQAGGGGANGELIQSQGEELVEQPGPVMLGQEVKRQEQQPDERQKTKQTEQQQFERQIEQPADQRLQSSFLDQLSAHLVQGPPAPPTEQSTDSDEERERCEKQRCVFAVLWWYLALLIPESAFAPCATGTSATKQGGSASGRARGAAGSRRAAGNEETIAGARRVV
jgi:hypothetical protein